MIPGPTRYQPQLMFSRRPHIRGQRESPCTLLIPGQYVADLEDRLRNRDCGLSRYVRLLVRRYRPVCLQHGLPQAGGLKRCYQSPGNSLLKKSCRIDAETWAELGQIAAFFGMSRCLVFVWLLKLDLAGGHDTFAGVPTNALESYDCDYPSCIELTERVYPWQNHIERRLRLKPRRRKHLPWDLEFSYFGIRRPSRTGQTRR